MFIIVATEVLHRCPRGVLIPKHQSFSLLLLLLLLLCHGRLFGLPLLVLDLSPILRNRLVSVRLLDTARKGRAACVELVSGALLCLLHGPVGHGHVPAEALAHVDHATLALAKALLQLAALEGQFAREGFAEAVGGAVALDHDTV